MVKKKKKKIRLKKQAYYLLAILVFGVVGIILGINFYNDFTYKQTDEYKLMSKGYSLDETKILFPSLKVSKNQNTYSA